MNREARKALITFIFPLIFAVIFLISNHIMQPALLKNEKSYKTAVLEDMDENRLYNLDGDILCFPKAKLLPNETTSYKGESRTIRSISEIRTEEFAVGSNYVATIKYQLLVPKDLSYGVILPGQFCSYTIFCNGKLFSHSDSYKYKNPDFPTPKYLMLPYSETGYYQLVINITSPKNCGSGSYGTVLFGTNEQIQRVKYAEKLVIYSLLSFVIFTIAACIVQTLSFRKDKVLSSFFVFTLATLFRVLFSDNVIFAGLIGHLPYQIGTVCRGIMIPVFLMALMFHISTIYEKYFPKFLLYIGGVTLLIPVVDNLTLGTLPALSVVASICSFIPYGICAHVIYAAIKDEFFYSATVVLGLTSLLSGAVIDYVTSKNIVPG